MGYGRIYLRKYLKSWNQLIKKCAKILIGDFHNYDFLDTSSAIQILNGNPSIGEAYEKFDTNNFGITTPSILELYNGIYKVKYLKKKISKQRYKKISEDLELLVQQLNVYSLDENAAKLGAKIHMQLKR